MPRFEPIGDFVFVRVAKPKEDRGILLPDSVRDAKVNKEATKGLIMAVGPECKQAKADALVMFPPGAGHVLLQGEEEYRFIREPVLMALIYQDDN